MYFRLLASIFFSLMIVINESGSLQFEHRVGVKEQSAGGHMTSESALISMASAEIVQSSAHLKKTKRHGHHLSSRSGGNGKQHGMRNCCSDATMLTSCSLMPSLVDVDGIWISENSDESTLKFTIADKFLPSIIRAPPRSPPRFA